MEHPDKEMREDYGEDVEIDPESAEGAEGDLIPEE